MSNRQWEYMTIRSEAFNPLEESLDKFLTRQGESGWELCGITEYGRFIFKRETEKEN